MRKLSLIFAFILSTVMIGCKNNKEVNKKIIVPIHASSNSELQGEVIFTEADGKVKMQGEFSGLIPNSIHAIHLHEKADCSAKDFSSAKGHWNPTDEVHGKWGDTDGFHLGDIGNLEVDNNGKATLTFETDKWCIDCTDDRKSILGKGIIVHQDNDDFVSQPTGNAGDRIGCGEITLY